MAEPFAAGVWSSLMQPRVLPQRSALARATRAAGQKRQQHPATTSTLHAPVPRQGKQKARAVEDVGQHILGCQAWACPPSKQALWDNDGSMRMTLMGELEPQKGVKGRVRRTSEASRGRFHALVSPETGQQRQYHASLASLGSAQLARDYSRSSVSQNTSATETQPNEEEEELLDDAASSLMLLFQSFSQQLAKNRMFSNEAVLAKQFDALMDAGYFNNFSAFEVLEFAQNLADKIDHMCEMITGKKEILGRWGQRMMHLTELIGNGASTSTSQPDRNQVDAIVTRAQAYMGFINQAKRFILEHQETEMTFRPTSQQDFDSSFFHSVLRSTVLSLYVYNNCSMMATLYLFETSNERWRRYRNGAFLIDNSLADVFLHIPLDQTLKYTKENWTPDKVTQFFHFVVATLNSLGQPRRANTYIKHLRSTENMKFPSNILIETCRGLVTTPKYPEDARKLAQELFYTIPNNTPDCLVLQQQYNLHRKPAERGIKFIPESVAEPHILKGTKSMKAFDTAYPRGPDGLRVPSPTFYDFHGVFHEHFKLSDYAGCLEIWEDVKRHSVKPDVVFLTRVVTCYKTLWNVDGLYGVLDYAQEKGVDVDNQFYSTIIRHFITRMDAESAMAVYNRAIAKGFVPDAPMNHALLNAFFRSGAWKQGFDLFVKLRNDGHKLNIEAYNAILQGFMYIGTPFKTVRRMFDRLETEGVTPNKWTYGILMHHALIAGQWQYTKTLYQDLVKMDEANQDNNKEKMIDAVLLTQMIRGYLHGGQEHMAREMIQQFKERGLQPTAVTHMSVARAYALSDEPGAIELAEDYIRRVMADPDKAWLANDERRMRKDPITMMYAPLLSARVDLNDVDGAERVMADLLGAGGKVTISIARLLLKLYGQSGQVDNFIDVWDHAVKIMTHGLSPTAGRKPTQYAGMQSITALTDIYIRTMSKWGLHAEVAATWKHLLALGGHIDEGNWNTYAHACLRAGELDEACQVIEHVMQPNFNQGLRNHFAEAPPLDATNEEKLDKIMTRRAGPPPPPLMKESSRTRAARVNALTNRHRTELVDEEMMKEDLVYPMRVLRKSGAHWYDWKPHRDVLQSFLMAMLYVEDGFPLRPMQPGEVRAHDIAGEITENRGVTEPLLARLFEHYPRTMYRLRRFRDTERYELGLRAFRRKYVSCR